MLNVLWTILGIISGIAVAFLLLVIICYLLVFYVPNRSDKKLKEYSLPPGKVYEPFKEQMLGCMKEVREMKHLDVSVVSFDGLKLRGKYFETKKGAPIELLMPGYRGTAERDLCIGVKRCFEMGHNALLVDQRASGYSEGNIITFGVKERKDCLSWIDFIIKTFGEDSKIILTGVSMGAATVLLTACENIPKNVIGVVADCGYTSAEEIIKKILVQIHLPVKIVYPLINWGAQWFGGFNLSDASVINNIKNCKVPVAFFHGKTDDFVPFEMTQRNHDACTTEKQLLLVENAGHGLCYVIDNVNYMHTLNKFLQSCENASKVNNSKNN